MENMQENVDLNVDLSADCLEVEEVTECIPASLQSDQ